jgi:hypothetical protein
LIVRAIIHNGKAIHTNQPDKPKSATWQETTTNRNAHVSQPPPVSTLGEGLVGAGKIHIRVDSFVGFGSRGGEFVIVIVPDKSPVATAMRIFPDSEGQRGDD